jgi:hypothetical protein
LMYSEDYTVIRKRQEVSHEYSHIR